MSDSVDVTGALDDDMSALLESGEGSDIVLMMGNLRLSAYKTVLAARSPVFAKMFRDNTQEVSEGYVSVSDLSEEALRQLLQFAYTDRAPLLQSTAAELMVASEKYNMRKLRKACEEQLVRDLCVESAATCAVLGILYSSEKLRDAAITFIRDHLKEILGTEGWAKAVLCHTETAVEICRRVAKAPPSDMS